jgi:Cupin
MPADPPMPDVLEIAASGEKPFCINFGSGAASVKLVCGCLACDGRSYNPLLENLPPVITTGDPSNGEGLIVQFVRFAVSEAADKRAGSESVLTKLSELMFIDVIRRYLEKLPAEQAGWLAGLRDPLIGKALSLMHAKPGRDWTLEELAKQAGLSRSFWPSGSRSSSAFPPCSI